MTVFHCEGFETIGVKTTSAANLETRITNTDLMAFTEISGGHTDDIELIDDFLTEGLALQMPEGLLGRGTYITLEWPSVYKVSTNASHPDMVTGFRYYNADSTPSAERTIWQHLLGATTAQATLKTASNGTDLVWTDNTGSQTISSVLSVDTWHYIEVEFKGTTSGNGGYVKVYVDGELEYTGNSRNIVSATFFTSYGVRIGLGATANETGANVTAFDDVYQLELDGVTHTAPLGDVRVVRLTPTSDETPNDWTPQTGSDNYAMVDNTDWEATDYVDAITTADDDHYGLSALSDADTVHGLQVDVVCVAVNGTPTLHIGFDDGTADESNEGVIATTPTVMKRAFFEDDPSGSAWTETSVNSVEATQRMTE